MGHNRGEMRADYFPATKALPLHTAHPGRSNTHATHPVTSVPMVLPNWFTWPLASWHDPSSLSGCRQRPLPQGVLGLSSHLPPRTLSRNRASPVVGRRRGELLHGRADPPRRHLGQELRIKCSRFQIQSQPSFGCTACLLSSRTYADRRKHSAERIGASAAHRLGITGSAGEGEPNGRIQGDGEGWGRAQVELWRTVV